MTRRRVLILGAGAIGSFVGGRLAQAGHQVGLLGRANYVQQVRTQGLTLQDAQGEQHITGLTAADNLPELVELLGGYDIAILTAKAYDTTTLCEMLRPLAAQNAAPLIVLQNGVGGEDLAAASLPGTRILSGVITFVVSVQSPGCYRVRGHRGGMGLAGAQPRGGDVVQWVGMLSEAGLACRAYEDYRRAKWSKLLLNIQGSALPAILDQSPAEVYADAQLYRLEIAAVREALAVMRAQGIAPVDLPGYPLRALASLLQHLPPQVSQIAMRRLIAGGRAGKKPSLQLDIERGNPRSEVTFLNGAVVRAGLQYQVPTPVNSMLTEVLLSLAEGRTPRSDYRRNPPAVVAVASAKGWRG